MVTASFFANYTFTEGDLKGFSVGGGTSFTGKRYLGTFNDMEHFGNTIRTVNAVFGYETRMFGDTKVRFALNIDNLTDETYLNSLYWADIYAWDQAYYGEPRNATLRLSYDF